MRSDMCGALWVRDVSFSDNTPRHFRHRRCFNGFMAAFRNFADRSPSIRFLDDMANFAPDPLDAIFVRGAGRQSIARCASLRRHVRSAVLFVR